MNNYIYIAVMAAVSYTIRVLPLTLIRKPIKNQFIQSFLYYVPYVTLAVMTFPAIIHATQTPISGLVALIAGIIAAWLGAGLFPVSVICCVLVLFPQKLLYCLCVQARTAAPHLVQQMDLGQSFLYPPTWPPPVFCSIHSTSLSLGTSSRLPIRRVGKLSVFSSW